MNKRPVAQEFYEVYGYYPDEGDLQSFMEETGYFDYNPYINHDRRVSDFSTISDQGEAGSITSEVKALFSDIIRKTKVPKSDRHSSIMSNDLAVELAFMSLIFVSKTALYFLVKYCQEHGYCTEL